MNNDEHATPSKQFWEQVYQNFNKQADAIRVQFQRESLQ